MKVFVYGTLKRGKGNHHYLENSAFLGEGLVQGMQVYHGPGFPYAYTGAGAVMGEVYEVNQPTAAALDRLEGYPYHYDRKIVSVRMSGPEDHYEDAWMYYVHEKPKGELIETGVWHGYQR
jgi:gamma-glutamylcyclotransferase (GGCT)/AIG2-like uncharacterized protein YtfP